MSRTRALVLLLLMLLTPLVAACGGNAGNGGNGASAQVGATANQPQATLKHAHAKLAHVPSGGVTLTWRPDNHTLAITFDLYGFAPNSAHPAQIHRVRCATGGPVQYDLGALTADGQGKMITTLTQSAVVGGVPSHDWYLELRNAAGDDASAQLALACANIDNADTDASHQQALRVEVTAGMGPNMHVSGEATFEIENGALVVVATLAGLEPFSAHPLFIVSGDCAHLGASVFSFYPAQADSAGRAKVKQGFDGVATIPAASWSLVVLRGLHLQSQIDAAPIGCGAIAPAP